MGEINCSPVGGLLRPLPASMVALGRLRGHRSRGRWSAGQPYELRGGCQLPSQKRFASMELAFQLARRAPPVMLAHSIYIDNSVWAPCGIGARRQTVGKT